MREGTKRGPGPRRSVCVCAGRTVWLLGQPRDAQGSLKRRNALAEQQPCPDPAPIGSRAPRHQLEMKYVAPARGGF